MTVVRRRSATPSSAKTSPGSVGMLAVNTIRSPLPSKSNSTRSPPTRVRIAPPPGRSRPAARCRARRSTRVAASRRRSRPAPAPGGRPACPRGRRCQPRHPGRAPASRIATSGRHRPDADVRPGRRIRPPGRGRRWSGRPATRPAPERSAATSSASSPAARRRHDIDVRPVLPVAVGGTVRGERDAVPSGDQAGPPSSQSPSVIWRGSPPSNPTTNRCARPSSRPRPSARCLIRRISRSGGGSGPSRIDGSSSGRTRAAKTSALLSGLQATPSMPLSLQVSWRASPPSVGITNSWPVSSATRSDWKASQRPSGDHLPSRSREVPLVSWRAAPPPYGTVQIAER